MINNVSSHYDALIDENNDPVFDPEPLKKHMDRWDGSAFIDLLDLNVSKSVLEIGVGTGRLAIRTAPLCRTFTGIDISEKTVEKAKQNLKRFSNVTLIHGDFYTFDFSEKYDVIYSSLTFMHFNNKADIIAKIYSLLVPNGSFVLSIDKSKNKYIECNGRTIEIYPDDPETTKTHLHNAKFVVESAIETEAAYLFSAKKRFCGVLIEEIRNEAGTRYGPDAAAALSSPEVRDRLLYLTTEGRKEINYRIYTSGKI